MKTVTVKYDQPNDPADELSILRKRVEEEHKIADQIEAMQLKVERCKTALKTAKEDLEKVLNHLYCVARSDIQQEIFMGQELPAADEQEEDEG